MKPTRDLMRWAEAGSEAPGGIATAIRSLRAGRGRSEQVEELGRRLAPQFAAPPPVSGGAPVSPWITAAGALLLSGVFGIYAFTRLPHTEAPVAVRPPARAVPTAQVARPAVGESVLPSVQPVLAPERPPTARVASKPHASHAGGSVAPAPAPRPAPETELVLLQRSQAALDRDAGLALALAQEHARDYPNGVFAQEREIFAIEALLKLRQRSAALARAEVFLRRYPESPHGRRVRALLDREDALVPATIQDGRDHSKGVPVSEGTHHDPN